MNLQDHLKSLVLKAANDFDTKASQDPVITEKDDDGTLHSYDLDQALATQKAERDSLWKELYQLEERQREMKMNYVFNDATSTERKQLAMLLYEDKELNRELEKQEKDVHRLDLAKDDMVVELQFRQRLQTSVREMTQLVAFIKSQLTAAKSLHREEVRVLNECNRIKETLDTKAEEMRTTGPTMAPTTRSKLIKAQQDHRAVMGYLKEFLDEYYPPHLRDDVAVTADLNSDNRCVLRNILEDLVNRAYSNPTNPYLKLVEGTYWSPYIETLVKGNIAERHPENPKHIRLVDFRIHDST